MTLVLGATAVAMTASALLMVAFEHSTQRPDASGRRLGGPRARQVDADALWRLFAVNSVLAVVLLFGVPWAAAPALFREGPVSVGAVAVEAVAVLALYDLLYYGMHRALHHKRLMRHVHRVHHLARAPSARESMYVHPVEFVLGIALLFVCVAVVGPVHGVSYAIALLVFQLVNVVIHCGLDFPRGPLRALNPWSHGHYGHHGVDVQRNFGQFTHLWDRLFGTALP